MRVFKHKRVTRRYACKAALYRRLARSQGAGEYDFSESALVEMFEFESTGAAGVQFSTIKARNGFAYGKWLRDLDASQMCEDVRRGDFCKAEFMSGAVERIHNCSVLSRIAAPHWFPYTALPRPKLGGA